MNYVDPLGLRVERKNLDETIQAFGGTVKYSDGKSKAEWFDQALGFNQNNIESLAKQIVFDPKAATQTGITQYGTKYNQVIKINGVNGKAIDVTFAWIKNNDGVVRLVTAIPTKK